MQCFCYEAEDWILVNEVWNWLPVINIDSSVRVLEGPRWNNVPRDATHGYTVLAITSLALLGSVLGKPFVRSQCLVPQGLYTESKLLFWIRKPLPRNTGTVSEETQLDVCKTIDFSKDQNWVFACMPHADSLLLLCARWHHHSKWLRLPKIAMEENHSPYYWKTSSKYNLCSILTFVCLLCFLPVPGVLEVCTVIVTLGQTSQANTLHTHTLWANQTSGI